MNMMIEWQQLIAVLDAGVARNVRGYAPGWCRYERQEITKGSVIYHLFQSDLEDVGSIELHEMPGNHTAMHIVDPSPPDERIVLRQQIGEMTAEFNERALALALLNDGIPDPLAAGIIFELLPVDAVVKKGDQWTLNLLHAEGSAILAEARKRLSEQVVAFAARRQKRHEQVIQLLFTLLANDGITREGASAPVIEPPKTTQDVRRKPSPDEVIEHYYRAHGQNRKITLKQVCEEMHVNYASIRVAKVAYDKRRKAKRKN